MGDDMERNTSGETSQQGEQDLLEQALDWWVKTSDVDVEPGLVTARDRWLAASSEHRLAWRAALEIVDLGDGAARLEKALKLPAPKEESAAARTPRPTRTGRAWAWAACVPLLLGLALFLWRDPGWIIRLTSDYSVAAGAGQSFRLGDGSNLFVDGDSALDVRMERGVRRVDLKRGRAWFDVVHDGRPFEVRSGAIVVRVLGTQFVLEREGGRVSIAVARGAVAVSNGQGRRHELLAGQRLLAEPDEMSAAVPFDSGVDFAWTKGLSVFDRADIDDVVKELERIRAGRVLVVGREQLLSRRFSATFARNQPDALLRALPRALGLRVTELPDGSLILRAQAIAPS